MSKKLSMTGAKLAAQARLAAAPLAVAVLALGLVDAAAAARIVAQREASFELHLADVQTFPQSSAGYLIFRTCPSCDITSMIVSADTAYLVGQEAVPLSRFIETAQAYGQTGAESTNVFIYYDVASKHINRVVLSHFGA